MKAKVMNYPNNIKVIESTSFDKDQDFKEHFSEYFSNFHEGHSSEEIARKKGLPLAII